MYFSRVSIDTSPAAQTKLFRFIKGDLYGMHQLIWSLFPGEPNSKRDFLYRQEFENEQLTLQATRRGLPLFYVLSDRKPLPVDDLLCVETKSFDPKLHSDMRLGFEIRANPVIAHKVKGIRNSSKHDIMMDAKYKANKSGITNRIEIEKRMTDAVVDWLMAKGASAGFDIAGGSSLEVTGYRQERLRKRGGKEIKFSSIDICGTLIVTDPEVFRKTLQTGIGHSRSFGCGMLLVRRV